MFASIDVLVSFVDLERLNRTSFFPAPASLNLGLISVEVPIVVDHMSTDVLFGEAALHLSGFVLYDASLPWPLMVPSAAAELKKSELKIMGYYC